MLRKKYRSPVHQAYRPMLREDIPKPGDSHLCVWCEKGRTLKSLLWCSDECQQQYLSRSKLEELRIAVQERDVNLCEECGKYDPHYAIVPRLNPLDGGGASGLDGVRTLCEQCLLDRAGELSSMDIQDPEIPEIRELRKAWRASGRRWRSYRYTIGPVIVSGIRWERLLRDYKNGAHHLAKHCSYRNRDHFRLLQVTRRWWAIVRRNSKNPHPLLVQTIEAIDAQYHATIKWAAYFRERGLGALD